MSDQVICVDGTTSTPGGWVGDRAIKGEVYTVEVSGISEDGIPYFLFYEIDAGTEPINGQCGYRQSDFRPIENNHFDYMLDTKRKIPDDKFDKEKVYV